MEIVFGLPQGSMLGPILLNSFLTDLFFIANSLNIANCANDNMPYATANDIDRLIASLEEDSKSLFTWLENILMKSNADKCHLLVNFNVKVTIKISIHKIANTKREKLLGVHLDRGLSFDYHISEIWLKSMLESLCASHSNIMHELI